MSNYHDFPESQPPVWLQPLFDARRWLRVLGISAWLWALYLAFAAAQLVFSVPIDPSDQDGEWFWPVALLLWTAMLFVFAAFTVSRLQRISANGTSTETNDPTAVLMAVRRVLIAYVAIMVNPLLMIAISIWAA